MKKTRMRACCEDETGLTWTIEWHGGAYADISTPSGKPVEVLNFWDYAKDAPLDSAPKNARELEKHLKEWIVETVEYRHNY